MPVGRAPPLCFSALPATWATPFLLASPLCKMLLRPSTWCSGVPKTRAGCPGHQGLPGESTDSRNASWTAHSTKQMGLIQSSCQNPDLQDTGQPLRPLPHQLGTPCYQLYRYCTCPVCAGGRRLFIKPTAHFWASPRERSLWPTPRPGCCHPSPLYPLPSIEGLCMLRLPA